MGFYWDSILLGFQKKRFLFRDSLEAPVSQMVINTSQREREREKKKKQEKEREKERDRNQESEKARKRES